MRRAGAPVIVGNGRLRNTPPPPLTSSSTSAQIDAWLTYLVAISKQQGGNWAVPDAQWKQFSQMIQQAYPDVDISGGYMPLQGKFAGQTFGPASESLAPGIAPVVTAATNVTSGALGSLIGSPVDFLNWISWIFHPLNILRAVEFVVGMVLLFTGIRSQVSSRSSGLSAQGVARVTRQLTDATPVGRARRRSYGRRMGTREGEVEHARLQARRESRKREAEREQARGKERRENTES